MSRFSLRLLAALLVVAGLGLVAYTIVSMSVFANGRSPQATSEMPAPPTAYPTPMLAAPTMTVEPPNASAPPSSNSIASVPVVVTDSTPPASAATNATSIAHKGSHDAIAPAADRQREAPEDAPAREMPKPTPPVMVPVVTPVGLQARGPIGSFPRLGLVIKLADATAFEAMNRAGIAAAADSGLVVAQTRAGAAREGLAGNDIIVSRCALPAPEGSRLLLGVLDKVETANNRKTCLVVIRGGDVLRITIGP